MSDFRGSSLGWCVAGTARGKCDCAGCACPQCGGAAGRREIFCSDACQESSRQDWLEQTVVARPYVPIPLVPMGGECKRAAAHAVRWCLEKESALWGVQ